MLAVQWHPEGLVDDDPRMVGLFRELVRASEGDRLVLRRFDDIIRQCNSASGVWNDRRRNRAAFL